MKHIVVIDDSDVVLKAATRTLELSNYKVTGVMDPSTLDVESSPPDLMLVDFNMPQFYGHDVVEFFKSEAEASFPIYMYSDINEDELKARAEECGADGYICKGWGLERLIEEVKKILGE